MSQMQAVTLYKAKIIKAIEEDPALRRENSPSKETADYILKLIKRLPLE